MNDFSPNMGMWATVIVSDFPAYEGTVVSETQYGIYLYIGGDQNRLTLFPWHNVVRVSYKDQR
jgi:hypothetical protein